MMFDFKPGDDVQFEGVPDDFQPFRKRADPSLWPFDFDKVYVVEDVVLVGGEIGLVISGFRSGHRTGAWHHMGWRKVQRRNDRLSLEAFFTVPGGFEEPRRAPEKHKEKSNA